MSEQIEAPVETVEPKETKRGKHLRSYGIAAIQAQNSDALDATDKALRRLLGEDFSIENCRLMLNAYEVWLNRAEERAKEAAKAQILALAEATGVDLSSLLPAEGKAPQKIAKASKA